MKLFLFSRAVAVGRHKSFLVPVEHFASIKLSSVIKNCIPVVLFHEEITSGQIRVIPPISKLFFLPSQ